MKQIFKKPIAIWLLVGIIFLYILSGIVLICLGYNALSLNWFFAVYLTLPIIFLFIHSVLILSFSRAVAFILFAFCLGFIVEWAGIQNGIIFGSRYTYGSSFPGVFGVPIAIPFYWAALTYASYSTVNAFLQWKNKEKPSTFNKNLPLLFLLIVCDCLVIFSIDVLLDPIAVALGAWKWENGGNFLGVPLGNFFGWMLMAFLIIGSFRIFEYMKPKAHAYKSSLLIIPVYAIFTLSLLLVVQAITLQLWSAVALGTVLSVAIFVYNMVCFRSWVLRKYPKSLVSPNGQGYIKQLIKEMLKN